ncbi:MAG: hypothetical protein IKZ96_02880 [Bacilli bacterium]|nr:hypothetical protein [Bacilli bacterium]
MNKILLVAEGNYDSDKLINALQRMVIDPKKEMVRAIEIHDMEYRKDDLTTGTQSFFMGQIVSNEDINYPNYPGYVFYEDENGMQIKEYYLSGILDEQRVLDSGIIEDVIDNEEDRIKVRNNPSLLLYYLLKNGEENVENQLREYGINGAYSVLDPNPDYPIDTGKENHDNPIFYFRTTHNLVGYTDKMPKYPNEGHSVSYYTNSREIMDYLGLSYFSFKKLEKKSRYYPNGFNVFSGTFLSYVENEANKKNQFPIGNDNLTNNAPISIANYVYTLKNKN